MCQLIALYIKINKRVDRTILPTPPKKEKKKKVTVRRLKPKHYSYSSNQTNQIATIATIQKKKQRKIKGTQ